MKTWGRVLIGIAIALVVLLVVAYFGMGYVISDTYRPAGKTPQRSFAANEMYWETNGGGQVTFSIERNGQDYDIHVTSLQFEKRDERFTITAESGVIYRAISAVMQDQHTISVYAPDGPPRGSWTTLRFGDSEHASIYEDVVDNSDLKIIYAYVIAQIGP